MKPPGAVPPSVDEDVRVYVILTKEGRRAGCAVFDGETSRDIHGVEDLAFGFVT